MNYDFAATESPKSLFEFHRRIHRMYREHYRNFLGISLPATIFGALAIFLTDQKVAEFAQTHGVDQLHALGVAVQLGAIRLSGFFVSGFLECYALAATAVLVWELRPGQTRNAELVLDSYSHVRSKIRPLLYFAFVTSVKCAFGLVGAAMIPVAIASRFPHLWRSHALQFWWLSFGCAASVLAIIIARYGFAIPRIVAEKISGHQAIKLTLKDVQGFDTWIFLLALESILVGYFSGQIAANLASYSLQRIGALPPFLDSWIALGAVALATAIAQPPLFIGCSLLYFDLTEPSKQPAITIASASFLPGSQQPPYHQ